MEEHLSKLGAIIKELHVIKATIPEKVKIMMLLMSLPQSYEYLVTFLESLESFNLKKLTQEVVTTRLLNEELMKKEKNKSLEIMFVKTMLLSKKSSTQRYKDKSEDVCNYCKQKRHWARECKKKKNEYVKRKIKQKNIVESSDQDDEAFVCALVISCETNVWNVDSRAFSHLSHCRKWFKTYENISPIKIYMGDNSIQNAIGRGNIKIMMIVGDTTIEGMVTNVLHVPRITKLYFFCQ